MAWSRVDAEPNFDTRGGDAFNCDDVSGIAVHIGARVAASAGAGETLMSSTVKDLVVGADLAFTDRGVTTLKGVPGEWRLYTVTGRPTSTGSSGS